ncbi:DUF4817 domain-containing protein [Trichonephila clavipes]|nr:DUF4817 domain-containing protein [Trichonephila clavipes]
MYTKEEYCEMVLLYGKCNRSKREAARLYALKFPSRRHASSCTIARGVHHLYKTGSCHRRIPLSRATSSSLRIPAEDGLEDMPWPILKVVSGILAGLVPTQNRRYGTYYIRTFHILIVQSWRRN